MKSGSGADRSRPTSAGLNASLRKSISALRLTSWYRSFRRTRLWCEAAHAIKLVLVPAYREANRCSARGFTQFLSEFGGRGLRAQLLRQGKRKKALVHHVTIPYAGFEAVIQKGLQMAGFECVSVGSRSYDFLRYDWLVGNKTGYMLADFDADGDAQWVEQQMPRLQSARDWLALTYRNVRVGQFVLSTALRWRLVGQLDFEDSDVRAMLTRLLQNSVRDVIAGTRLLDEVRPDCVLFMDRGYAGAGELFDLALQRGIDIINWNFGYKSNRLALKRYNTRNDRDHPLCPSAESWKRMRSVPWSKALGDEIRKELFGAYASQDWFSAVGTQFNKRILSREETFRELGLSPDKKVAVIFPHILWDGSFFYGEDLFQDYTEWLVETIKAACANDRIQWVVKLHPAHVVKSVRDDYHGKPAELAALEGVLDTLPSHIKLVHPETPVSTYSLMQISDCTVTVRGTVGIESALFGIPVVTAGTGRYDRRGFTIDSASQDEYRTRLAELETYPRLTRDQIELAERYAYYVFLCRPLRLSCVSLDYARDSKATPIISVRCQTAEDWLTSPDMIQLAEWFRDGVTEDFVGMPLSRAALASGDDAEHHGRGATRSEPATASMSTADYV